MPILKICCDENSSTHERRCITDFNNFCEKYNITVDDKQWLVEGLERAVIEQEGINIVNN